MPKKQTAITKVPITERALLRRINRRLAANHETLKSPRGEAARRELGYYYRLDLANNTIKAANVDLGELGRELGVLRLWEVIR
jgi:hypothetical protein